MICLGIYQDNFLKEMIWHGIFQEKRSCLPKKKSHGLKAKKKCLGFEIKEKGKMD